LYEYKCGGLVIEEEDGAMVYKKAAVSARKCFVVSRQQSFHLHCTPPIQFP
jgi:hypothetical protein